MSEGHQPKGPPLDLDKLVPPPSGTGVTSPEVETLRARVAALEGQLPGGDGPLRAMIALRDEEVEKLVRMVEWRDAILERDLAVLKMAWRKHQMEAADVGWNELGDRLCDRLCDHMGGDEFAEWADRLKEDGTEPVKADGEGR